jgi:hypothetical protein
VALRQLNLRFSKMTQIQEEESLLKMLFQNYKGEI